MDAADHEFLCEIQARVGAMAITQEIRIVKGLPSGLNAAIQKRIESTLSEVFRNPNSLSSPGRVVVRTIPDSDARVGLRGQSVLFAAQHTPLSVPSARLFAFLRLSLCLSLHLSMFWYNIVPTCRDFLHFLPMNPMTPACA